MSNDHIFPVPAEVEKFSGDFHCQLCGIESVGENYELTIDFTKPGRTGIPDCDRDTICAGQFCRRCWEEHAGQVQHWYETEYLPKEADLNEQ